MINDHLLRLGKLVGNLQSLECLLRAYLLGIAQKGAGTIPNGTDYWNLRLQDVVPENEFTNYDSLSALIDKYNTDVRARDESLVIGLQIVEVRDLLAHGRVASRTPDLAEMAIVKFDRPSEGNVAVVACARMTDSWFDSNIKLTYELMMKVRAAYERFVD
jgi:hypothetical protein